MHPAYSVIAFTTLSGAGYGLLFWLSAARLFDLLPAERWMAPSMIIPALFLITAGLLSSTMHLGHPERAFRAFSQWRSSWLSREGVLAVFTYMPAGLQTLIWLFALDQTLMKLLCALSALGAIGTVYCTGMIYASLRTIRQWHTPLVPSIYLILAATSGLLLFGFLLALYGYGLGWVWSCAVIFLALSLLTKSLYWRNISKDTGRYTAEMALGLKAMGAVRPLDPPHTQPNFVMREMGYKVARKHAARLKFTVIVTLGILPLVFLAAALVTGWHGSFYLLALLSATPGLFAERWLFFAEAVHVSQLYYGLNRA